MLELFTREEQREPNRDTWLLCPKLKSSSPRREGRVLEANLYHLKRNKPIIRSNYVRTRFLQGSSRYGRFQTEFETEALAWASAPGN